MSAMRFRSSSPDSWTLPRPHSDASQRYMKHGPIQPMLESRPSLLSIFRWR